MEKLKQLIEERKLSQLRKELMEMNVVDIADFISEMSKEDAVLLFRLLPKDMMADVFAYLDSGQQESIIERITDKEVASFVDDLFVDDVVDFLEEVPANIVKKVMKASTPENQEVLQRFMQFPKDSAGSLMTVEFVELKSRMTVAEAMDFIKRTGLDKETIYTEYVIDDVHHLIGVVALHRLITAPGDAKIADVMEEDVISVLYTEDQEQVALTMGKYDLMSLPVVDHENRLIGLITVDDIVDVIQEEATEDIEKMAAITPSGKEYLRTSVFSMAKSRLPWLLLLMISATFTGSIISHYEELLASAVILTSFIPMLMDTAGNGGSQSSVTIIRGLALGEIAPRDIFRVLFREIRVALICGFALAAVNFLRILVFVREASLGINIVVSLSLFCTVILAKIIGGTLPLIAKKIGFDPAVMASPLITTIVDALSLFIFFGFSVAILNIT